MNVSYYASPRDMRFKGQLRKDFNNELLKGGMLMTIEERIEGLEVKLARARLINRLLAVLGIGVLLVIWFFSSGTPTAQEKFMDEVRAKRFVLVDENGKTRAGFSVFNEGTLLLLNDKDGKKCISMDLTTDKPAMNIYNPDGSVLWQAP